MSYCNSGFSSLNRDEPLWKRAFKAAWEKSGYIFKEKISPFHEECFSVECSGYLKYSYRFVGKVYLSNFIYVIYILVLIQMWRIY